MFITPEQQRELDSRYRSFPGFSEWEELRFDDRRWSERLARLRALRAQVPEATFARARQVAVRAADGDVRTMRIVGDLASSESPVSVSTLCRLHVQVCSRQDVYPVNTSEGSRNVPLRRGHFKTMPNYALDGSGRPYGFAPVHQVASEMERLVLELSSERFQRAHPVLQASYACSSLLAVHPFADGNVRVAVALASAYQHRATSVPVLLSPLQRPLLPVAAAAAAMGEYSAVVVLLLHAASDSMTLVIDTLDGWSFEGPAESVSLATTRPGEQSRSLVDLPKVDLHVHLEGSIRPSTLADMARRHRADLPPGMSEAGYSFTHFQEFVANYVFVCRCLQDEEDFSRIAYELCADEAAEGVRYAEVTFTPALHAMRLDGRWDMPVAAVLEGFARGRSDFGITCRLVLDHARTLPLEMAEETLSVALRHRDAGVVALGLGGDEAVPPELFARVFARAVDAGLHSVPHAGEMAGPASIRGALRALQAERIGHGIRILEDPDLVAEARSRSVAFEVCPTSNVATGAVYSLEEHPLPDMLAAGLVVTLNSDDPAMFSSPLSGEYELARRIFRMDDTALASLARAGVRASFADGETKHHVEAEVDAWLEKPGEEESR